MSADVPAADAIWADIRAAYRAIEEARKAYATDGHPTNLRELVKRRYETGDYGHAHLALRADQLSRYAHTDPRPLWDPDRTMDALMGVPIVVDDTVPPNRWELRDNATGNVVTAGVVDEEPTG